MPKILSQSGVSLADTYRIEGSVAGVENLESRDVSLFDEMGGRVFSERAQSFIITLSSTAILQSVSFDINAGSLPDSPNRILGIQVIADTIGRTNLCQVSVAGAASDPGEFPLFVWDTADDVESNIRYSLAGAAAGSDGYLVPSNVFTPFLMTRMGAEAEMGSLQMRGQSSAFGAGTVTIRAFVMLCRANPGNPTPGTPSSHGLPIPSW